MYLWKPLINQPDKYSNQDVLPLSFHLKYSCMYLIRFLILDGDEERLHPPNNLSSSPTFKENMHQNAVL